MKKWSDSMGEVKFESRERVIEEIMKMESEKPSVWNRIRSFMNREVEIPIAAAASVCMIVFVLGTSGIDINGDMAYSYSITVVDQGGQYETY
ncbi:MAG: hypothetical protein C0604_00260 [Clostridiales bacterium]|nr:MAG: hypothetical protein C0604_00260 [Clostridiales bacterium]